MNNQLIEIWERWVPLESISEKLELESFVDNEKDGFFITLTDKIKKKYIIFFDGLVLSYRITKTELMLEMTQFLTKQYGADFYSHWSLFTVKNSNYIHWFLYESYSWKCNETEIIYYVLYTSDRVIEILSTFAPEITIKTI